MKEYKAYVKDGRVVLEGLKEAGEEYVSDNMRFAGGPSKKFAQQMKGFFSVPTIRESKKLAV